MFTQGHEAQFYNKSSGGDSEGASLKLLMLIPIFLIGVGGALEASHNADTFERKAITVGAGTVYTFINLVALWLAK